MDVEVEATRSGSWWAVAVPQVPGALTQVRDLSEVPAAVVDAVALVTGLPARDVRVAEVRQVPAVGAHGS